MNSKFTVSPQLSEKSSEFEKEGLKKEGFEIEKLSNGKPGPLDQ